MSRDIKLLFIDIKKAINNINDYIKGLTINDFAKDSKTQNAVLMSLQIIGEAVNNLPSDIKLEHNIIEWYKIIGLRNVIAHDYFKINIEIIWNTVKTDIPILKEQIEKILNDLSDNS